MKCVLTCAALGALVASSAMAADFPQRRVAPVVTPASTYSWTGAYIGASAGFMNLGGRVSKGDKARKGAKASKGGRAQRGHDIGGESISGPHERHVSVTGGVMGAQAGYNYQIDSLVLGLEGDINRPVSAGSNNDRRRSREIRHPGKAHSLGRDRLDWYATLRPRVGVLASERVMLYGTGGLVMAGVTRHYYTSGLTNQTRSSMRPGWTLGAGVEAALMDNISLRTQYDYISLAGKRDRVLPASVGRISNVRMHVFRVGLNYKF